MLLYLIFPLFILFTSIFFKKNSSGYLFLHIILIIFISSFKSLNVGIDTQSYFNSYSDLISFGINNVNDYFIQTHFEPGFVIFMKLTQLISNSYTIFNLISYSIIYLPFFFYIKKYSPDYSLSLIILFTFHIFAFNLSGLRQALAGSIYLLAYLIYDSNKINFKQRLLYFIILILFASTFHISALITLIVPFLLKIKFTFIKFTLGLLLMGILTNFQESLSGFLKTFLRSGDLNINIGGYILFQIAILMFYFMVVNILSFKPKNHTVYSNKATLYFIGTILLIFTGTSVYSRFSLYFSISIVALFPLIIDLLKMRPFYRPFYRPLLKFASVSFFIIFFYYYYLLPNQLNILPYNFHLYINLFIL